MMRMPRPTTCGCKRSAAARAALDRVLGEEIGIEDLDLGARALGRGSQPLQSVGRDRRHPLKGIGVDEQGPKARPGGGRPGGNGHVQASVLR